MASWLTHLRVAEKVKERITGIDFSYFLIGSIAPDSGMPDESQRSYTPSKEITHCRYQNENELADMDVSAFFDNYLVPEKIITRSDSTRSFLWAYYFHLITDKLWLEEYFKPLKLRYENEFENPEKDFVNFIREEMVSLDFEYLREKGSELVNQLKGFDGNINFFNGFDSDYIYKCRDRIVNFYSLDAMPPKMEYKYLTPHIIEEFVAKASDKCISILVV